MKFRRCLAYCIAMNVPCSDYTEMPIFIHKLEGFSVRPALTLRHEATNVYLKTVPELTVCAFQLTST